MAKDTLTAKQRRFIDEFVRDGNATQAYHRAGYSASNDDIAAVEGHKLLRNPKISAEVAKVQSQVSQETRVEINALVKELAKVAFTNLPDLLEPSDELKVKNFEHLTDAQRASILEVSETKGRDGSITRKLKLHPKLTAIDMLMKNLGGYVTSADLIDKLPPERLEQLIDELLAKLKR